MINNLNNFYSLPVPFKYLTRTRLCVISIMLMSVSLIHCWSVHALLTGVRCQLAFNDEFCVNEAHKNAGRRTLDGEGLVSQHMQLKNHQQSLRVAAAGGACKSCKEPQAKLSRWMADIRIRYGKWRWAKKQTELQVTNGNRKTDRNWRTPPKPQIPKNRRPPSKVICTHTEIYTHCDKLRRNQKLNKTKRKTMTTILHSYANACPPVVGFRFWVLVSGLWILGVPKWAPAKGCAAI